MPSKSFNLTFLIFKVSHHPAVNYVLVHVLEVVIVMNSNCYRDKAIQLIRQQVQVADFTFFFVYHFHPCDSTTGLSCRDDTMGRY